MRLIDSAGERRLGHVQVYLSPGEARQLMAKLGKLVAEPEAREHFHLLSEDGEGELSIVTLGKLNTEGYTSGEGKAFGGWKPRG